MDINKLKEKFEKIDNKIIQNDKKGLSTQKLQKEKIIILKACYEKLSDAINSEKLGMTAPNFAKEIAFLSNIKEIQMQLNESTSETDAEIQKIYEQMQAKGFAWILDNMPEKKI